MPISRLELAETAADLPLCSEHVVLPQKDDVVIALPRWHSIYQPELLETVRTRFSMFVTPYVAILLFAVVIDVSFLKLENIDVDRSKRIGLERSLPCVGVGEFANR